MYRTRLTITRWTIIITQKKKIKEKTEKGKKRSSRAKSKKDIKEVEKTPVTTHVIPCTRVRRTVRHTGAHDVRHAHVIRTKCDVTRTNSVFAL